MYKRQDYAHHPTEIIETINALSFNKGRLIVVIQPHRYSRLRDNYNSYIKALKGADISLILPVFEAGEKKIKGISSSNLVKDINKKKCSNTYYMSSFKKVENKLKKILKPNDIVIFMGAGSISSLCNDFAKELTNIGYNNE